MKKQKEKFTKSTHVRLPFDRRHEDPSKNYGIHGLDVWFILKGPKGAVQFAVTFPVYLPHVEREYLGKFIDWNSRKEIMGFDVGYHSPKPMYEGQRPMKGKCQHLGRSRCYYDGSGLRAMEWAKEIFAVKGAHPEDLLWKKLEEEYELRFETEKESE